MKKEIKEYIVQVILILFSVVLGLYLNKKIEDRNERKEAEKLFSLIKQDLADNRLLLLDWQPYHKEISENLRDSIGSATFIDAFVDNRHSIARLMTRGTFMERTPSYDAWEMAKSNPILMNIGYDKMFLLSKIYNQQLDTFDPVKEIYKLYNSTGFNTSEHAKENLQILQTHLQELEGRESLLIQYYDQAFEEFQLEGKAVE